MASRFSPRASTRNREVVRANTGRDLSGASFRNFSTRALAALAVTNRLSWAHILGARPSGAHHYSPAYPGLTPGATFLTRLAALCLGCSSFFDDLKVRVFSQTSEPVPFQNEGSGTEFFRNGFSCAI